MDSEDEFSVQSSGDELILDDDSGMSDVGEEDSDGDLDDYDDDMGFSQEKPVKKDKKSYEVDFKVLSPEDIERGQDRIIDECKDLLGQPKENIAILLRHFKWNRERLMEKYLDDQHEVLESTGLEEDESGNTKILELDEPFMCEICCDDEPGLKTYAMKCGHRFCVDCYKTYLATKIKDEGEAARIKCPGDGCNRILDSRSLNLLVGEDIKDRFVLAASM
jgi:ariadne-1